MSRLKHFVLELSGPCGLGEGQRGLVLPMAVHFRREAKEKTSLCLFVLIFKKFLLDNTGSLTKHEPSLSKGEWRRKLTPEQFYVTQEKGTEPVSSLMIVSWLEGFGGGGRRASWGRCNCRSPRPGFPSTTLALPVSLSGMGLHPLVGDPDASSASSVTLQLLCSCPLSLGGWHVQPPLLRLPLSTRWPRRGPWVTQAVPG